MTGDLATGEGIEPASVVGADRIPLASGIDRAMFGYCGSKLAAEPATACSGPPWTTLRATQFHDLLLMATRQMAKLPVVPVPAGFRLQPIDPDEVATRLAELALSKPAGPPMSGTRPAGYPTWVGRGRTARPTCSVGT